MSATVVAVSACPDHRFSKISVQSITLVAGIGVAGDAHAGVTVKHRSRVARDPTQPNLRQVHLLASELVGELHDKGFDVEAGTIGENVLTAGIDLIGLPTDTRLHLGSDAVVIVTGLRNPCVQLHNYQEGLTAAVLDHDEAGALIRKAGVMAVVAIGGVVRSGDPVEIVLPALPHRKLECV